VRVYGGDLGETLSAGAALNRVGLGLDMRVGADAVQSGSWPGSDSDPSLARGEHGPDTRDPPASERRRGERKRGWAGRACCARGIWTGARHRGPEREKEMGRRGSAGPREE
jgi:hypothetical protein